MLGFGDLTAALTNLEEPSGRHLYVISLLAGEHIFLIGEGEHSEPARRRDEGKPDRPNARGEERGERREKSARLFRHFTVIEA
ncbi:MAG: hypothetical protein OXK78_20125 [Caldilineaceae bacterium]|nr:hypothetical protein [Caldilineaceae bacterium]